MPGAGLSEWPQTQEHFRSHGSSCLWRRSPPFTSVAFTPQICNWRLRDWEKGGNSGGQVYLPLFFFFLLGRLRKTDTPSCTFQRQILQLYYKVFKDREMLSLLRGASPPLAFSLRWIRAPAPGSHVQIIYFMTASSHLTTASWICVQDGYIPEDQSPILLGNELGHHQHLICITKA